MKETKLNKLGITLKEEDLQYFQKNNMKDSFYFEPTQKTKQYNLEGIKRLLSVDDYFQQVIDLFDDKKRVLLNICKIKEISHAIKKNEFVSLVEELYNNGQLDEIKDIDQKIALLKSYMDINRIIEDSPIYSITILGKQFNIETEKLIEFITTQGSDTIKDNTTSVSDIYGIPVKYFAFAVKNFIQEKKLTTNFFVDKNTIDFINKVYCQDYFDIYSLEEINETKDIIETTELHPELIDYVFNNIPENYTDLEKALFVYLKLCRIFVYSPNVYASQQSAESNALHSDINLIPTLTPTNNSIVCYQFAQVYATVLKSLGINYSVDAVLGEYGHGHMNLTFKADDFVVFADSTTSILGSDLLNVKTNSETSGLICKNPNSVMQVKFKNILDKVYRDFMKMEPSPYTKETSLDNWRELYATFDSDEHKIELIDRIDVFKSISVRSTLPLTEKAAYLTKIYNKLFKQENKSFMTIVSKNLTNSKEPTMIISYTEGRSLDEHDKNKYLLLHDNIWVDLTRNSLQNLFDNNFLSPINNILPPGINDPKRSEHTQC